MEFEAFTFQLIEFVHNILGEITIYLTNKIDEWIQSIEIKIWNL